MDSVWLVSSGAYSDYRIEAIFATEAEARAFTNGCENQKGQYDADSDVEISEWKLGPPDSEIFHKTWRVYLHTDNGALYTEGVESELRPRDWSEASADARHSYGRSVISRDHALKLAAEARQKFLRAQQA